jgi:hypothetical protein
MKQFYVLLALSLVFPRLSHAQDLAENNRTANSLLTREIPPAGLASPASSGTASPNPQWEREQDQINGHINSGKLSNMKIVTETIVAFLHDSCLSDEHYTPAWHGEYFSEKTSSPAGIKFGVFCNFYEQKAKLTILANDLSPLLGHLLVNNQHFFTIPPTNTVKNGAACFTPSLPNTEEGSSLRSTIWLITADNHQLLYTPVSRREYLREARMELNNIKNFLLTDLKQKMPVRSAAVQEAEKKTDIEQLNRQYSGIDLQMRMKMLLNNYKTDEEYFKENADKETAGLDSTLHLMDHLAGHMSAAELDRPAIVSGQAADFQGFEDGQGGKMLIRMNTSYFNPSLSAEKPQFFVVSWQYDPSAPTAVDLDQQIRERLDCEKLKEMLFVTHAAQE